MHTWVKAAIAAGTAAAAFGIFSYFSGSAKAAPSSADAAKKGSADGCAAGTADGKAGTENLNATDPSTNATLAKAAKASGDSVAYLAAYAKDYDSCFAAASKKPAPPGTPATHVATDCKVYSTWPAAVQSAWNEYEAHKGDGATSAYATSGKASALYGQFVKLGCSGNAATVQATIQSWIDAGGTVTGGPDCKDLSTWPKALADTYKLYTSDPRAFVDGGPNNGPALVKALAAIGCPGTAATVQHTYDLELAAGNIPGASTSGPIAYVGGVIDWVRGLANPFNAANRAAARATPLPGPMAIWKRRMTESSSVYYAMVPTGRIDLHSGKPTWKNAGLMTAPECVHSGAAAVTASGWFSETKPGSTFQVCTPIATRLSGAYIEDSAGSFVYVGSASSPSPTPRGGAIVGHMISACANGVCTAAMALPMSRGRREPKQLQKPVRVGFLGSGIRYDRGSAPKEIDRDLVFRSFSEAGQ